MSTNTDERLINLEIKITQQDHIIEELNEVIIEQQKRIEDLELKTTALIEKFKELMTDPGDGDILPHEKPPHY
ncbi:SlyX protein [Bdellovibrio bacteriovorus W]|nr:SlyX protein [Bdellovibrio bacteriovorus W]